MCPSTAVWIKLFFTFGFRWRKQQLFQIQKWSLDCDGRQKRQGEAEDQDAETSDDRSEQGVVVLLAHGGSEDGQEIVVDEVNAISQSAERHESLPRQKPIDKTWKIDRN